MKRLLTLVPLLAVLASCTPTPLPPAASITGAWEGAITKFGMTVNIKGRLLLTDSPNRGDFTGTADLSGLISVPNASISGNVQSGNLVASNGSDSVSCTGSFSNNNYYSGSCSYGGYSGVVNLRRTGD